MKRIFSLIFFAVVLLGFFACSADYDTFGTSGYKKFLDITFKEQDGTSSLYDEEHLVKVTLKAPPEGKKTWEKVTIEDVDLSSMATLHLVKSRFKDFPTDSAGLDSLAAMVSIYPEAIKAGSSLQVPESHVIYFVVKAENDDRSIWKLEFDIPGVEAVSSSSENEGDDVESSSSDAKNESSSSEGDVESSDSNSSSSVADGSSSSVTLHGNNDLKVAFIGELSNKVSNDSIFVTFAQGTDLASVKIDTVVFHSTAKIDKDPKSVSDWENVQKFVVTAENGSAKTWYVVVTALKSSATNLELSFEHILKERRPEGTDSIVVMLENGTHVADASLTDFSVSEGASASPDPKTITDWTASQTIKVVAEDGTERSWIVVVVEAAADEAPASSEKELVSISAENEVAAASIDVSAKTVVLHMASKDAMESLNIHIVVSDGARHDLTVAGLNLLTSRNFTITAEDKSSVAWTISADYVKSDAAEILSFEIVGVATEQDPVLDSENKKISFKVPYGTDLTNVSFDASYSDLASKETPAGSTLDLSSGSAKIVVKAENGSSKEWTVLVDVGEPPVVKETPRILAMKIAGGDAVVDSVQENGQYVYWVHYDNLKLRSDLTSLKISDIKLTAGAEITGVTEGSSYDLTEGVKVSVSNGEETLDYEIRAGYQYTNNSFTTWSGNVASGWANGNTAGFNMTSPTNSNTAAKMQSMNAKILGIGQFASGNLFTGYFNPKSVGATKMMGYKDGNELIDFGVPFAARPRYIEIDFTYAGLKDSCDLYILMENRTATSNEGKNQYRSSSDVNTLVGSAWYRSTTDDNTGRVNPDVVSITTNSKGFKTLRLKMKYGQPYADSPIYNSNTFKAKLEESAGIDNHLVEGTGSEVVTHLRVVMASSSDGNHYKGTVNATLIVDEIRFIY